MRLLGMCEQLSSYGNDYNKVFSFCSQLPSFRVISSQTSLMSTAIDLSRLAKSLGLAVLRLAMAKSMNAAPGEIYERIGRYAI